MWIISGVLLPASYRGDFRSLPPGQPTFAFLVSSQDASLVRAQAELFAYDLELVRDDLAALPISMPAAAGGAL